MGHFGAQNHHFQTLLKVFNQVFVKLNLMAGIKKWVKLTVLDFERKFLFNSK